MNNVLYDASLWRRELIKLVVRLGVPASYPSFFESFDRQYLADVHCGFRQFDEALQSFLLGVGLSWAQIDEIEAASRNRRDTLEDTVRPLPGVVSTIERIAGRGLSLAILADSPHPASRLTQTLARLGLENHFAHVLSSFDLQAAQPAVECYQAACEALALPVNQVAFVGSSDPGLMGARNCGLRTVAVHCCHEVTADVWLAQFSALDDLVARWQA